MFVRGSLGPQQPPSTRSSRRSSTRALGAVREHWTTFTCPECGKRHRAEVSVPDVRSRVAAIELLLREGLGRPAQAEEPPVAQLPDSAEAIRAMTWHDLQAVFALQFADDIAAVAAGEAGSAIRKH